MHAGNVGPESGGPDVRVVYKSIKIAVSLYKIRLQKQFYGQFSNKNITIYTNQIK